MADMDRQDSHKASDPELREMQFLDEMFAAAREDQAADVSSDLMARVLADAEATQAGFAAEAVTGMTPSSPRRSVFSVVLAALGGWPSVSGLAAAAVAGLWIGVAAGPAMMQGGFVSTVAVSADETYLSALDDDYAYLGE